MAHTTTSCLKCNTPVNDNFCPKCGRPSQLKRIDAHYVQHEITHALHFEKGFLFTIKELIVRPGHIIRYFITTDRSRIVKPVIFIIISSLIYSVLSHFFHIEDSFIQFESPTNGVASKAIDSWIHNYYGYSNILEGLFIAFWLKMFFRKSGYNFFEIVILLCFTMGIGMLIFSLAVIFRGLTHINLMQASGIAFFIYMTWALGQFFDGKKITSYVKAFAAYTLGMLSFLLLAGLLGYLLDKIIAH